MEINSEGLAVYTELRGEERAGKMLETARKEGAAGTLAGMSLDFVFGKVWCRDGLDRKQRSLVTIGVLIALRQTEELKNHFQLAIRNGLTIKEIDEAVVQTAPYAGFPAAWAAALALKELSER